MNKINTTEDKEATRMLMQQLEEDSSIDVEEVIKYPPVAISCGIYQDRNFDGSYTEYPLVLGSDGNFSFIQENACSGIGLLSFLHQGIDRDIRSFL